MTAELVRGQNHPLSGTRLEIRVSAGGPVVAGATLAGADGKVAGADRVAHPASHRLPGLEVSRQAAADHRLAVDLEALPEDVHRVHVMLALPTGAGGPTSFGALAAPFFAVTELDGAEIATFTITDLGVESAVVALELYRRQGAWKVRAVGQGYAGGLAAMLHDQGLEKAFETAAAINEAVIRGMARTVAPPPPRPAADPAPQAPAPQAPAPGGGPVDYRHPRRATATPPDPAPAAAPPAGPGQPPRPVAGDANGWTMNERLYNQVWGMFEDLARSAAAYRSAVDFAESRLEQELDKVLSDPATRVGPAADAARAAARARQASLVEQARAVLDRDLAQLAAEAEVVEHALPPAFARWDSPVWQGFQVPLETPMALRLGELHLPERTDLRIPMLVRLPLERGLWIDSGRTSGLKASIVDSSELRRLAMETAVAHAARLLAVHPVGDYTVHVIDPAGAAGGALAPLLQSGALKEAPAAGAQGVSALLERLTRRVDLVQMAARSGAADSLPPDVDTAEQLLIVNDFPHGFDDRSVNQLRYIADEGPSVGVHLMMVADREDARGHGPVLDPLWRALLRITPVPDDHLADPWVGHTWTYEPSLVPVGSDVLGQVLRSVGQARQAYGI
ncbi:TerD family protein [Streptomyces telluris]|uniref:TerD family protein n=1 Tax=Streptomyces telluris TaxID=2720021 RepID=A0A9X2RPV5_9ACTN|nr:TerD family protein [Streptomyces telluris]MCQ8771525.1 TerD family protein [Streptomyces telluris]NJP78849.1 TerD family protein [Streptomyces telluris]